MSQRQIEEQRQRALIVKVLRAILIILLVVVTSLGIVRGSAQTQLGLELFGWWWVAVLAVLAFFGVVVGVDIITAERKLSTISAILFGTLAGLIATMVLGMVIDLFVESYEIPPEYDRIVLTAKVILGMGLCYIGITTVLQTQDDFRLVIPYVEFAKQFRGTKPLLLDTSALVDGRILHVAEVGCFQAPFIVPRFVIDELQTLSDSGDPLRRARGRRGLELLSRMQRSALLDVTIDDTPVPGAGVDQMLVELARSMPAVIVTTDLGLNRVAAIHGVQILNLNDLANSLKPNVIPGQTLTLPLIKPGEQPGQAVGYLEDGMMVVVERAESEIGHTAELIVTSSMQTSAGRLIFARLAGAPAGAEEATDGSDTTPEPMVPGEDGAESSRGPAPASEPDEGAADGEAARTNEARSGGPIGPHHKKKKLPGSPRNPRRL